MINSLKRPILISCLIVWYRILRNMEDPVLHHLFSDSFRTFLLNATISLRSQLLTKVFFMEVTGASYCIPHQPSAGKQSAFSRKASEFYWLSERGGVVSYGTRRYTWPLPVVINFLSCLEDMQWTCKITHSVLGTLNPCSLPVGIASEWTLLKAHTLLHTVCCKFLCRKVGRQALL